MNDKKEIELTNEEFFFLASLFDCEALIGVPDPFIGYWVEEIDKEMKRAARSLMQKGYILYKGKDIDVMPAVAEYIQICTGTNVTLWLQAEKSGEQQESYYYVSPHKVIESKVFEEDDRISYLLHDCGKPEQAWEELLKKTEPDSKPVLHDCAMTVPFSLFEELLRNRDFFTIRHIEAALKEYGALPTAAKLLAKAMKNYEYYSQFTAFHEVQNTWCMDCLCMLYGKEVNWFMHMVEKPDGTYAEVRPASLGGFEEAMRQVVLRSRQKVMSIV